MVHSELPGGSLAVVQGGNSPGNAAVVQSGEPSGVELHVVDGRLIACRPGEPPPLSVRHHAEAFLEWLKAHEKVPGNEVPVAILEHVLYPDFLRQTGLPAKPWRTVSHVLAKLHGVEKYQADWRDPTGDGTTPVVFKIRKRRRAFSPQAIMRRSLSLTGIL